MKSTIFSLLPLAGIALASESVCGVRTVTVTEYEHPKQTPEVVVAAKPSSCTRSTVTTTTWEKVYVTVTADDYEEEEAETTRTIDVTRTSTLHLTTTSTVHRSRSTPAATPAESSVVPDVPYVTPAASSVKVPTMPYYPNTTTTHEVEYSLVYTPVPQSEAYQPSASAEKPADASAAPTSKYETPAKSTPAPKPNKEENTSSAGSKGDATFYGGNVDGGMCSFSGYTLPSGVYGTALSDSNWAGGDNCGVCVQVTGPSGNKIKAMVVDQCPGCGQNHLDLFPDAFKELADPSKGVIPVSWDVVPCGITSPIVLKNKEGTSKFWFSMQVMNSDSKVQKLEVSTDGGATWKSTTRKEYNYFEQASGFGTDKVDVKVTSVDGKSVIVKGVSVTASSTVTASSNFS